MGFAGQKLYNLFIEHSGRLTYDLKQPLTRNDCVKVMLVKSKSIQITPGLKYIYIFAMVFSFFPAAMRYVLTPSFLGNVPKFY